MEKKQILKNSHDNYTGLKDVSYHKPELSGEVLIFEIPTYEEIYAPSEPDHPFYSYHDKNFSKDRLKYSTIPVHVGPYPIKVDMKKIVNVLRCPIKTAGSREIKLPAELEFLTEYIKFCCIYETSFNSKFDETFVHITVDYKNVKGGETQRVPGWHVDGFQGSKFPQKHAIEHSYLWASACGTEFCPQPFFVSHIDESKYLIFDEINKQVKKENITQTLDSNVYIFDPYMVHRSPVMSKDTERLLVRITIEYNKLLDPNDTINPVLQFSIPHKYDIRRRLGEYTVLLDKEMYGFRN